MATPTAIRRHYDSLSFIYRAFWGDHIHHGLFVDGDTPARAQLRLVEYCVSLLEKIGGSVLDVGCGHGATAICLAQQYGCCVLGITISEKQAQIARALAASAGVRERVTIVAANAETFAYPTAQFDLLWTMESSEHFADKWGYFQNAARSLGPAGELLLCAWTGSMASQRVCGIARRFLCPELWTREQYENVITAAGLRVRAAQDLSKHVVRTWEVCSQRARAAGGAVKLLPAIAREFVQGIELVLEAYGAGELGYTVIAAQKP
jgi:tocopherol O-methyltransferase